MILFISSFEIIHAATPDLNIFLYIAASAADAAVHGIQTVLGNCLSTFPIKDNPVFNNDPKSLPKKRPDFLFYEIEFLII